ncbi:MAG: DEAD/DEAH box helicase, partial [Bryobacteraceae bacterium]
MPASTQSLTARKFFSRSGLLSRWHPNYEYRPGQLEMAEAVESALAERRHLIVEAGTGTGKTLAYLVPAILSAQRIVISTGTLNLQEQLFYKDLPFLQQHFETPLRACYMKGRNNFACRQKIYDAEKEPILQGLEEVADFQVIREWEKTTETGDRSEIKTLPEGSSAWGKIDARRELCTGQRCKQFDRCFLTLMHQRAVDSDIIIVNHHLFFADLAVKEEEYGGIIPQYGAVIFDEAHEIEDIAGQYFGLSVSNHQFLDLRRDVSVMARRRNFGSQELDRALEMMQEHAERFFGLFPMAEGRTGFQEHDAFLEKHSDAYLAVLRILELVGSYLQLIKDSPEEAVPLFRRTRELADRVVTWIEAREKSYVYWVERRGRGCYLQATPVDVSQLLTQRLFNEVDTVILTSATLAVAGGFEFTEKRLGIPGPRSLIVESEFDYPNQALLYVPQHLPDPRTPLFSRAAGEEIASLLRATQGRAFVLFTSYQQMRVVYDYV